MALPCYVWRMACAMKSALGSKFKAHFRRCSLGPQRARANLDLVRRDMAVEVAVGVLAQLRGRERARVAPALAAQRRRDGCAVPSNPYHLPKPINPQGF